MPLVFGAGAGIGVLGGMIGLGGAEFRLPLLISLFGFAALSAVILNKAMSLVVVLVALPARLAAVSASEVAGHWPVAVNLLAGSLLGAWAGATWTLRMRSSTLHKVLAALMVLMAAALLVTHISTVGALSLPLWTRVPCGVVAGFGIGAVAAIMGVAGGELLIPTIVLLFGADIKAAGSLSLLVSLPTMLVAFARYSRDRSFAVWTLSYFGSGRDSVNPQVVARVRERFLRGLPWHEGCGGRGCAVCRDRCASHGGALHRGEDRRRGSVVWAAAAVSGLRQPRTSGALSVCTTDS